MSKNWDFPEVLSPWFWSKIRHFSIFFFLGNVAQDNVFSDILEQRNASLGFKNNTFLSVFPGQGYT